jgi:type II secretory pathway component GspD/PulD (secretin)
LIEILIRQLDQHPSAESVIKIFTLVNADAYTVTTMLQSLFSSTSTTGGGGFGGTGGSTNSNMMTTRRPGIEQDESTLVSVRFVAEVRTNSIVAIGSAGDMMTVETILMRLDEENMNNRKVMTIKLVNTPASDIATVIQSYVTGERTLELQNITSFMPHSPKEQYLKEVVVVPEPISNTLIISCTPRFYDQIRSIVQKLDERPRVVAIQALIAEVSMNDGNERGFEIGLQDSILFQRSLAMTPTVGPGFLFGSDASLPTGNVGAGTIGSQGISHLGTGRSNSSGVGGFTFSASSESLSILMRALEEKDKLRILSRPQLTAMHNMRATVSIGQEVPFVGSSTTSYGGEPTYTTEWRDVKTTLDITPRINADEQIVMSVYVGRSSLGSEADGITTFFSEGQAIRMPKISNSAVQTTISTMDGQTIIIGGVITEQKEFVNRSVPVLNKIPLVKHFFEYESHKTNRSELLIILTPTIIRSDADMERLRQQEYSRMHWCLSDVIKLTGKSEMRTRTDQWSPYEVPHVQGTPTKLQDSQLPPEENIKKLIPIKVREE